MWFTISGYEAKATTEPHSPIPGLYISSATPTRDKEKLNTVGITHILTAAKGIAPRFKGDFKYMLLDVDDWVGEDLLYYFEKSVKFIDDARKEGGKVLVHCMAGISRSATIVIAYIMYDRKVPFKVAFDMVKQVRPFVQPNPSFKRQLEVFERWTLGVQHPPRYHYNLHSARKAAESAASDGTATDAPTTTESSTATTESSTTAESSTTSVTTEPAAPTPAVEVAPTDIPSDGPSGADTWDMWQRSECETLYKLEWLLRQAADGIRRIGSGADPHLMFKEDMYDKYSSAPDRSQPTYLHLGSEANEAPTTEKKLTVDMVRRALGCLNTKEDKSVGDEEYENLDETKLPERPRVSHKTRAWCCSQCNRYLATPLNVLHLAPEHMEVELMEWMADLGQVQGKIKCPKCNAVVGEYSWQNTKLDDGGYLPVFKLNRSEIKQVDVDLKLAEVK